MRIKKSKGAKFRSKLEKRVNQSLLNQKANCDYESDIIPYTLELKYKPDFTLITKNGHKIYIEVKGEWDSGDRSKHIAIKQQRPDVDIRFIFGNVDTRISKGSRTTYRDIVEGRGRGSKGITWQYNCVKQATKEKRTFVPNEWLQE